MTPRSGLPNSPQGACGERAADPVFREPWEAHAFAITVDLHARGLFTWEEWTRALSAQIASARESAAADTGEEYYRHWLAALETLVAAKGLASADELAHCIRAWDRAAERTPHGRPIELQPRDFI
jgi:nitrile hydratase accessory protein